jgi:hypothetical protein
VVVVATYKNGSQVLAGPTVAAGGSVAYPQGFDLQSNDEGQTVTLQYYAGSVGATNLLFTLTFRNVSKNTTRQGE